MVHSFINKPIQEQKVFASTVISGFVLIVFLFALAVKHPRQFTGLQESAEGALQQLFGIFLSLSKTCIDHFGTFGCFTKGILASWGVLFPFAELHFLQEATMFVHDLSPPRDFGTM